MDLKLTGSEGVDYIHLAQDKDELDAIWVA